MKDWEYEDIMRAHLDDLETERMNGRMTFEEFAEAVRVAPEWVKAHPRQWANV